MKKQESEVEIMNCINCYKEIPDDTKFCPYCGAQQIKPAQAESSAETPAPEVQAEPSAETSAPEVQAEPAAGNPAPETAMHNEQPQAAAYQGMEQPRETAYQAQQTPPPVYNVPPVQQEYMQEPPVNWVPYLVLSILSTILCCTPFGIVAIVFAAKINSAVTAGNMAEAKDAAKKSKIWIIVSAIVGVVLWILMVIYFVVIGVSAAYYY